MRKLSIKLNGAHFGFSAGSPSTNLYQVELEFSRQTSKLQLNYGELQSSIVFSGLALRLNLTVVANLMIKWSESRFQICIRESSNVCFEPLFKLILTPENTP